MIRLLIALALIAPSAAIAASCEGHPDALGTARVLEVDPAKTAAVGRKQYPQTLSLAPKEVVLTFDDGPWPGTTEAVLAALREQCVKATFFLIGRNAAANPKIVQKIAADGHTIAHHSYSHPLLSHLTLRNAEADIDRGIAAVEEALGKKGGTSPFFRFPGFASSPILLKLMADRHMTVFSTDVWASDWNPMAPEQELRLVMARIEAAHGGIVLLHDPKRQTAAMLPSLLRALKRGGFSVVHVVPAPAATPGSPAH